MTQTQMLNPQEIKVRAFREGFFGGRLRPVGAEFLVPATTIESAWFAPVDDTVKLRPRVKRTLLAEIEAEVEAAAKVKRQAIERDKAAVFGPTRPSLRSSRLGG